MSTDNGEIYLVENQIGRCGNIADGNELGMFDDAGGFFGKCAPVIKDGKAYLIDRNMNRVSEMIGSDTAVTLGSELFIM